MFMLVAEHCDLRCSLPFTSYVKQIMMMMIIIMIMMMIMIMMIQLINYVK